MTILAIAVLLSLSNDGCWFAGSSEQVTFSWTDASAKPPATVRWTLSLGNAVLAKGEAALPAGARSVTVHVTAPTVRVRTDMTLSYEIWTADADKALASEQAKISLFPLDMLKPAVAAAKDVAIAVWDPQGHVERALRHAGLEAEYLTAVNGLRTSTPNIIIIGPDALPARGGEQTILQTHAQRGASVLVMRQSRVETLFDYRLRERGTARQLIWRDDHPAVEGLAADDLATITRQLPSPLAVVLPPEEAAMEIAYWRTTPASDKPAPLEAMLLTRRVDAGRLVLCQVPMRHERKAADDAPAEAQGHTIGPLDEMLLSSLLNYLRSEVEPTPPPSAREKPLAPLIEQPTPRVRLPGAGAD